MGSVFQRFFLSIILVTLLQTKANIRSMEGNVNVPGKLPSPLMNGNAAGDSRTLTPCDSDMFSIKATVSRAVVSLWFRRNEVAWS